MEAFGRAILIKMQEGEDRGRIIGLKEAIELLRSDLADEYKQYMEKANDPYIDNKKWANWLEFKMKELYNV